MCLPKALTDKRLEYLRELLKASCFWRFEETDMAEAKKKIGDLISILAKVPAALLMRGTPQEVEEYCKKLIGICAPSGGSISSPASTLNEARPENTKAMI